MHVRLDQTTTLRDVLSSLQFITSQHPNLNFYQTANSIFHKTVNELEVSLLALIRS